MITAFPEVTETLLTPDVSVIILGCDGIWECKSNQYIAELFSKAPGNQEGLIAECENFLDTILAPNTKTTWGLDNMSLIVVKIGNNNQEKDAKLAYQDKSGKITYQDNKGGKITYQDNKDGKITYQDNKGGKITYQDNKGGKIIYSDKGGKPFGQDKR